MLSIKKAAAQIIANNKELNSSKLLREIEAGIEAFLIQTDPNRYLLPHISESETATVFAHLRNRVALRKWNIVFSVIPSGKRAHLGAVAVYIVKTSEGIKFEICFEQNDNKFMPDNNPKLLKRYSMEEFVLDVEEFIRKSVLEGKIRNC